MSQSTRLQLPRIKQQIYDVLRRHGEYTAEQIIALVWQLHPQDAPHRSAIKAHICQMNKVLRGHGLVIATVPGQRRDGPLPYRMARGVS